MQSYFSCCPAVRKPLLLAVQIEKLKTAVGVAEEAEQLLNKVVMAIDKIRLHPAGWSCGREV